MTGTRFPSSFLLTTFWSEGSDLVSPSLSTHFIDDLKTYSDLLKVACDI